MFPSMRSSAILNPPDPVFVEPWEAHVFALVVAMQDAGVFTAGEWASALGESIRIRPTLSNPILETSTYGPWIPALEDLLVARGLTSGGMLEILKQLWNEAALAAPHGAPIILGPAPHPAAM